MRAVEGKLHWLSEIQKHKMVLVHSFCIFQACAIGWLSCVGTSSFENFVTYYYQTDGTEFTCTSGAELDQVPGVDALTDSCSSDRSTILKAYSLNLVILMIFVGMEIAALMITGAYGALYTFPYS